MRSVNTALLFVGNPTYDFDRLGGQLNARLSKVGIELKEVSPDPGCLAKLQAPGYTISICDNDFPLAAENFYGALDSPLSQAFLGVLSDALTRHNAHLRITITPDKPAPQDQFETYMSMLRTGHGVNAVLCKLLMPAAVHWHQSNQLLSGPQYLRLAGETTPWALFARARIIPTGEPDEMVRRYRLMLDGANEFIGRPVCFADTSQPVEESHAAALSFLSHAVENGSPIPHGHSFGARSTNGFTVAHIPPDTELPLGMFELSVVSYNADTALDGAARPSGANPTPAPNTLAPADSLMADIGPTHTTGMLGANVAMESSVWRNGFIALGAVALAMVISAYTFMGSGQENAAEYYQIHLNTPTANN